MRASCSALALDLREDGVGAVILGPYEHLQEGDWVRTTGRIAEVPVGDELVGRVVNALGEQLDDRGPIETAQSFPTERVAPGVIERENVDTPDADRAQGDRLDDPDRSRTARADHRRPPDREDRDRDRRHHQPEGHRRHLHLRRDRPERAESGADQGNSRAVRGDGAHDHRRRHRVGSRAAAVPRAVCGLRHGRILHAEGRPRADHLRRPDQARGRVPRALAAAAAATVSRGVPG